MKKLIFIFILLIIVFLLFLQNSNLSKFYNSQIKTDNIHLELKPGSISQNKGEKHE